MLAGGGLAALALSLACSPDVSAPPVSAPGVVATVTSPAEEAPAPAGDTFIMAWGQGPPVFSAAEGFTAPTPAVTPAPPAPPPPPAPHSAQLTPAQARQILADVGTPPEWTEPFVAIGEKESRWSPGAIGDSGRSLGWLQLNGGWFHEGEDPFDPHTNARVAVRLRHALGRFGGAGGWSVAEGLGLW